MNWLDEYEVKLKAATPSTEPWGATPRFNTLVVSPEMFAKLIRAMRISEKALCDAREAFYSAAFYAKETQDETFYRWLKDRGNGASHVLAKLQSGEFGEGE